MRYEALGSELLLAGTGSRIIDRRSHWSLGGSGSQEHLEELKHGDDAG
jgi:hypothetical protein